MILHYKYSVYIALVIILFAWPWSVSALSCVELFYIYSTRRGPTQPYKETPNLFINKYCQIHINALSDRSTIQLQIEGSLKFKRANQSNIIFLSLKIFKSGLPRKLIV